MPCHLLSAREVEPWLSRHVLTRSARCSMPSTGMTSTRSCPTSPTTASSNRHGAPTAGAAASWGIAEVRRGLAQRFEGIPDVHYSDDDHFVCGKRGVSEWTISGTTVDGARIEVRGCDLWTFAPDGKITRKDSYWKIREP